MIRIKKRGKIWWMEIHHNGVRERFSLKTRDREIADELRRQKELEILSGGRSIPRLWPLFLEEFTGWIESKVRPGTMRGYRYPIVHFSRFLEGQGIARIDQISHTAMAKYCSWRAAQIGPIWKRQITPGGIKFDLRVLRRVFSYAVLHGYLNKNPVAGFGNLAADAGRTLPFTQGEVTVMLDAAKNDKRMSAILNVFLHTGLRLGDMIALEKTAVRGPRWEVKTRKRQRWVRPLVHPALRPALDAWHASQSEKQIGSDFLFTTKSGRPMKYLDQELRRLWKRCGIHHGHAHRFRDTFAVRALEQGWTLDDVSRALGIGADVVARHYAPFTPGQQDRQDEMIRSLDFNLQRRLPGVQ